MREDNTCAPAPFFYNHCEWNSLFLLCDNEKICKQDAVKLTIYRNIFYTCFLLLQWIVNSIGKILQVIFFNGSALASSSASMN